jgi:serine/threonine protein kinase
VAVQSVAVTAALRPADPRRLGEYRLLGRLGEGGMGTVFLGRGRGGRLVAVKVIRPEFAGDQEFRARFRSEVNRARQVPPFCTAEVLDADPDHATPYLVVEYVDGPSLAAMVTEDGPLPPAGLHSVAVGVATALAAIHGAGVVHRDLKPRNVLLAPGAPKVIDFGIARAVEPTSRHTRTDQMIGTIAYMAPERFDGDTDQTVGPAADVFAWGAVITYAGNGRTPFAADSPTATAARILTQPPELGALSGPLRDLVAHSLAKEPRDRPTALELLDELLAVGSRDSGRFVTDLSRRPELQRAARAVQESRPYAPERREVARHSRRPKRSRIWLAAALTAVLVLGGSAVLARTVLTGTVSAPPGRPSPSAPAAPAGPQLAAGQAIVDSLSRRGLWRDVTGDSAGSCAFHSQLVVTTKEKIDYFCPGPADRFTGDQSIAVDATNVSANACAVVWFRDLGTRGYQLSLCPDEVRLDRYDDNDGETLIRRAATDALKPGLRRPVKIAIVEERATVSVAGRKVLDAQLTDPSLGAGRIVLGATNHTFSGQATAAFANLEIRSTGRPASAGPTYVDVRYGRTNSTAKLLSFDPGALSAVIEPIILMPGPDYCRKYGVPVTQPRCQQNWTIEDSQSKIDLPVSPEVVVSTTRDGDQGCLHDNSGTCPLPLPELAGWLKLHPQALTSITSTDGVVTGMAELPTA